MITAEYRQVMIIFFTTPIVVCLTGFTTMFLFFRRLTRASSFSAILIASWEGPHAGQTLCSLNSESLGFPSMCESFWRLCLMHSFLCNYQLWVFLEPRIRQGCNQGCHIVSTCLDQPHTQGKLWGNSWFRVEYYLIYTSRHLKPLQTHAV